MALRLLQGKADPPRCNAVVHKLLSLSITTLTLLQSFHFIVMIIMIIMVIMIIMANFTSGRTKSSSAQTTPAASPTPQACLIHYCCR